MAASRPHLVTECKQNSLEKVTSHSIRPMSFTAVKETDCLQIRNENEGHYNFFSCDGQMDANASETCYIPTQPLKLSDTNPFEVDVKRGCWADVRCKEPCSHIYHPGSCTLAKPLTATLATPSTNPFTSAYVGDFIHSTPMPSSQLHTPCCNSLKHIKYAHPLHRCDNATKPLEHSLPIYEPHKSHVRQPHSIYYQASSESEDDYDS